MSFLGSYDDDVEKCLSDSGIPLDDIECGGEGWTLRYSMLVDVDLFADVRSMFEDLVQRTPIVVMDSRWTESGDAAYAVVFGPSARTMLVLVDSNDDGYSLQMFNEGAVKKGLISFYLEDGKSGVADLTALS